MSPAAPLETFTAGQPTAVDVAEIERQLAALWGAAAESGKATGKRAITRACVSNLVAYCESDAQYEHATDTIRTLTSRHPCRALVLLAAPTAAAEELTAAITAHCHLAEGGGKQVCCEQISLLARGAGVDSLPGAVLPLLESDLPTVLWWQGNFLTQPELFARLSDVTDRVFFDTSLWNITADQTHYLPGLVGALTDHPQCGFCDLSWTRLTFWRQLTADLFDSPECRGELSKLEQVRILHGRGPGAEWRAMLYGGWLAAQLGWPSRPARARFQLASGDSAEAAEVGLLDIELRSPAGRFTVRKRYGERAAITVAHLAHVCELPRKRAFWPTDDASLLSQELDRPTRRRIYERALRAALELWC